MPSNNALLLGNKRTERSGGGRRWRRRLGIFALAMVVLLPVLYGVFLRWTRLDAPKVDPAVRTAAELPVEIKGPRAYICASWMSRERGVWEEPLEGEPYALGYAQARLGSRLLLEQEDYMFSEMNHYVPS